MRPRYKIREQLYREGSHDSDELRELQLEVLLDIRDLLIVVTCGSKVQPEEIYDERDKRLRSENHQ